MRISKLLLLFAMFLPRVAVGSPLPDNPFMDLYNSISDLEKRYEATRAREQSLANRLLGAAAIGATGIGGMQMASAMAEQQSDEAAERDMRAYLATFRCDYGAGRNIMGGETNIQLPGSDALIEYTTEYKQLVVSLKSDKEALGMLPGIESETVFDSATTGLFNNGAIGKTSGAFTSLSRALRDENSADRAALDKQKSDTASHKKTGTIIGGAGAIGGAVGNLIINRDKGDKMETNKGVKNEQNK